MTSTIPGLMQQVRGILWDTTDSVLQAGPVDKITVEGDMIEIHLIWCAIGTRDNWNRSPEKVLTFDSSTTKLENGVHYQLFTPIGQISLYLEQDRFPLEGQTIRGVTEAEWRLYQARLYNLPDDAGWPLIRMAVLEKTGGGVVDLT